MYPVNYVIIGKLIGYLLQSRQGGTLVTDWYAGAVLTKRHAYRWLTRWGRQMGDRRLQPDENQSPLQMSLLNANGVQRVNSFKTKSILERKMSSFIFKTFRVIVKYNSTAAAVRRENFASMSLRRSSTELNVLHII